MGSVLLEGPRQVRDVLDVRADLEDARRVTLTFDTYTHARNHFKDILDAAEDGRATVVNRDQRRTAVVDAARLQRALSVLSRGQVQVIAEPDGAWTIFLPGVPVAAQADEFDVAVADFVDGLRDYAEDWQDDLRLAPNHADNWGLVQFVALSSDDQLRDWVLGNDS